MTTCPHCGKTITESEALGGLCPECLLKAGFVTGASIDDPQRHPYVPPTPEELARYFPQLEILEPLGHSGMGAVYKARQKQLDRLVAVKILPPHISSDPSFAERFAREAKALAKLNHPNIVTLYEFGQADGLFYFLMEYVDGVNLRQLLDAGRLSPREALAIVPQICDALQYAHDQGIVHRDIKPENILMDRRGRVKVADFGLAKLAAAQPVDSPSDKPHFEAGGVTDASKVMGTPQYMAPEQLEHPSEVDHRADIYSLGVVFYQMLTGELPKGDFSPPSKKVVIDVRLDEVVLRAMEKRPELRYQHVGDVKTMVETIATTPPPQVPSHGKADTADSQSLGRTNSDKVFGKWALRLCAGGLALPAWILAFHRPTDVSGWITVISVSVICELVALVIGIIGWKSGAGKTAVIVAALLVVPGSYLIIRGETSSTQTAASRPAASEPRPPSTRPATPATRPAQRLQFRLVADANDTAPADTLVDPAGKEQLRVRREVLLDESAVARASVTVSPENDVAVTVDFNEAGANRFADITAANIGRRLAVVFDGKLLSAPTIRSVIRDKAIITGNFTAAEVAEVVANALNDQAKPGTPMDEEQLRRLAWGLPAANGLRAACYFEPMRDAYVDGEVVECRVVFHNSGKKPVRFSVAGAFGGMTVTEDREVPLDQNLAFGGMPKLRTFRLEPGQGTEIKYGAVAMGASAKAGSAAATAILAKPGATCRAQWRLHVSDVTQTRVRVELKTGEVRFRIARP